MTVRSEKLLIVPAQQTLAGRDRKGKSINRLYLINGKIESGSAYVKNELLEVYELRP